MTSPFPAIWKADQSSVGSCSRRRFLSARYLFSRGTPRLAGVFQKGADLRAASSSSVSGSSAGWVSATWRRMSSISSERGRTSDVVEMLVEREGRADEPRREETGGEGKASVARSGTGRSSSLTLMARSRARAEA